VIDHQFGTTDVLVVLPMQNVTARYRDRFAAEEPKLAA
jgi:putative hemolysin